MADRVRLEGCVNCQACIMACSLHHTGAFSYKHSSIAIHQEEDGFSISFHDPFTCDACEGEGTDNYRCIKYCYRAKDALRNFILNEGKGGDEV